MILLPRAGTRDPPFVQFGECFIAQLGGVIHESLTSLGVVTVAISVDAPTDSKRVVQRSGLPFEILADRDRSLLSALGIVHEGGGPRGSDIALPSIMLVNAKRRILWQYRSTHIHDRLSPEDVLDHVRNAVAASK